MNNTYDLVVIGLGAMGSSALWQAARRGLKVLGVEQFSEVPHSRGSHHGHTRIIRKAYFEHPSYVPFVLRSYDLWRELELESGQELLVKTGGLIVGPPTHEMVEGAVLAARLHHLPYEELSNRDMAKKFPSFHVDADDVAIYEPDAGYLRSDIAVRFAVQSAQKRGAEVWLSTQVIDCRSTGYGVEVRTSRGSVFCERCILTVGAWAPSWLQNIPLQVERQICFWFEPQIHHDLVTLPIFLSACGDQVVYGFPYIKGQGLKIAVHHDGETTTPEAINRAVTSNEIQLMRHAGARLLPVLEHADLSQSTVCMYTNTEDFHFVIGHHPSTENIIVAAGFSGHGFKFAPAVGELLVKLARGDSRVEVPEIFDPSRTFRID